MIFVNCRKFGTGNFFIRQCDEISKERDGVDSYIFAKGCSTSTIECYKEDGFDISITNVQFAQFLRKAVIDSF